MRVFILFFVLFPVILCANEVSLGITKGFEKIDIFVDKLQGNDEKLVELSSVLKWDLGFSGFFRQSEDGKFSDHNPIVYSIKGEWETDSLGNISLVGNILDAASSTVIMTEEFSGKKSEARILVHKYAAFVVDQLIGERSSFLTSVVYVRKINNVYEIRMTDIDGYNDRVLVSNSSINLSPAISNAKTNLAYISYKNGKPHLYLLNLRTNKEKNVSKEFDYAGSPVFSNCGNKLAFSASVDGNTDIYIYNLKTKKIMRITRHWAIDTQPSFSPTGFELSFTSDRGGKPQIYTVNSDGTMPSRLSWSGSINENSAWSLDGTKVAFASYYMGGYRIYVKEIISGDEIALPFMEGNNESPSWGSTGRHIIVEKGLNDDRQITIINIETLDNFILGKSGGSKFSPYWSK